jgi:hypothetical protein
MAVFYNKGSYVFQQYLFWGSLFCFTLVLAYAFLKDIFIGLDGVYDLSSKNLFWLIVALVLSLILAWRLRIIYRLYASGRNGETAVKNELLKFPEDYTVFHGLQLPGFRGDIDFVVVSPYGICTVEVKNHSSHRRLDLRKVLSQSQHHGMAMKKYLNRNMHQYIWVDAVLVFPNKRLKINSGLVNGVHISVLSNLNATIESCFISHKKLNFDHQSLVTHILHL